MIGDGFPTTELMIGAEAPDESLLEAALRGLGEKISAKGKTTKKKDGEAAKLPLDLYCPSQAPIGVKLDVYDSDQQKSTGYFGTKTFFIKVQYDDGKINSSNVDFAWLDRTEVVNKVQLTTGEDEAKFYQYML